MDSEWYPLPETLGKIQGWQINGYQDCEDLLAWVQQLWKWDSYFTCEHRRKRNVKGGRLYRTYHVSTGGWSGHEDMINAMQENYMFWGLAWYSSRKGGHFEFRV